MVTKGIYMVGGALGRRVLDNVNVGHGKDALFSCAGDLPLIPVLIHLPQYDHPLTLHTANTPPNTKAL